MKLATMPAVREYRRKPDGDRTGIGDDEFWPNICGAVRD